MASPYRSSMLAGVAVQGLGPLAGFATVFLIAHLAGVSEQGKFAQARAWIDLLVVIGCFGFPQGFIYVVNKLGASARVLAWWSIVYSAAFFGVAWLVTWLSPHGVQPWVAALAAALLVLHGLWRGLFLTARQGWAFGVFTMLPAVLLLPTVWAGLGRWGFDGLIMLAAIPTVLLACVLMRPVFSQASRASDAMPWGALWRNGTQAFAQALFTVAQPLLAYALLRWAGAGDEGVGLLYVGVFLIQGASVPLSLVAPLLFARWTSEASGSPLKWLDEASGRWLLWGLPLGAVSAGFVWWIVPIAFGASFEAARGPAAVMMLSLPAGCQARLVAPALHAAGWPGLNTWVCGARLMLTGALGMVAWALGLPPPLAVAVGWASAELLAALMTLGLLRRHVRSEAKT